MDTSAKINKYTFAVLPLVVFLIVPWLHDPNGIPKLIALGVGAFLFAIMNYKKLFTITKLQILPWLLLLAYGIIQLIRKDDLQHFLLGSFYRNGGYIALICLTLIFTITVNISSNALDRFNNTYLTTSYGLLIFGAFEVLEILPFKLTNFYQNALTLTLTNPNFASAYLGTFISVFIIYILLERKKAELKSSLILLLAFFLLYKTQSIQGYLIISFNIFLLIFLFRSKIREIISQRKKLSYTAFLVVVVMLGIQFNSLFNWMINNGSVRERLSYWKLSLDIWQDNKTLGVGLENLREYSTKYRDLNLVKQEGIFTAPDRSHNVVLDHFVNGGFIAGISWLFFIVVISYLAFRNLLIFKKKEYSTNYLIVIIIWFSYLLQSLISVDHLALTLLGYISAGLIVGINTKKNVTLLTESNSNKIFRQFHLLILTIIFSLFLSYSFKVVKYEYDAYEYLYKNDQTKLQNIYDSKVVVTQTLEDVSVKISQTKDFSTANLFAQKLLIYRPSSHQAYYIKSVYFESKGDIPAAKSEMLKALVIDKFNTVYLLGMSIYEYKLGNKVMAEEYLAKTIAINPNQQGIDIVSKLILGK